MTILMENEQELDLGFDYEKVLKLVIEKALEQEKCPYECEVNMTFTDNEGIRNINREFTSKLLQKVYRNTRSDIFLSDYNISCNQNCIRSNLFYLFYEILIFISEFCIMKICDHRKCSRLFYPFIRDCIMRYRKHMILPSAFDQNCAQTDNRKYTDDTDNIE